MSTPVVTLEGVGFTYNPGKRNSKTIFEGVDLTIGAGQMVGLVGPSGSGKTTLLGIMAHLQAPTDGKVWFYQTETTGWGLYKVRRDHIGLVTQTGDLDPSLTALQNVWLAPRLFGKKVSRKEGQEILRKVGLPEDAWGSLPKELSGGERQRVAMARALACKPSIIFADEPTANLDGPSKSEVLDAIRSAKPADCAVVIVSHDVDVVSEHCSRILRMEDGTISEG